MAHFSEIEARNGGDCCSPGVWRTQKSSMACEKAEIWCELVKEKARLEA